MNSRRRLNRFSINSAISRTAFDVRGKEGEILKIEAEMQASDFWNRREYAASRSQELAALKREVGWHEKFAKELADLGELVTLAQGDEKMLAEVEERAHALAKELESMETELYLSGPYDKGNAVLAVYSGAGGKDAEDWAALLFRMYHRYAERKEWHVRVIHEHWGENRGPAGWGIKNATLLIEGRYAYGYLRRESGVHRLVRISPFSSQSLRHTSFALVDVMPEMVAPEEVEIRPEDLKIEFFRSSGPGGQNVNKRETAVRITHLPTGAQAASQVERSQERNRETAMKVLRGKLYQLAVARREAERKGIQQEKKAIEWGSQIRSYVMHPYQMVKDHRTGIETSKIDAILDGELDEFIEAELKIQI